MTQDRITIRTAADLLAGIPALLGYVPAAGSAVVFALRTEAGTGRATVAFTARLDLGEADTAGAATITDAAARNDVDGVIVVVVADEADMHDAITTGKDFADLLDQHATVAGLFYVPTLAAPTTALSVHTLETHPVDPTASRVAVEQITRGQRIERSRADIARRFARTDHIAADDTAAVNPGPVLEELAAVVYADELPDARLIARTAAIITAVPVRDAMFRLATYGITAALEVVTAVATHSRGQARVNALILAGWLAHCSGNGAVTQIAYDAADAETAATGIEQSHLLGLLRRAIDAGMTPTDVRSVGLALDPATIRALTGAALPGAPDRD